MIEVKNRSEASWGPLARCDERDFNKLINNRKSNTKDLIKNQIKQHKKLKTYKVTFLKEWHSDSFEILAESDYDISSKAREYFVEHKDKIGFKEKPRGKWAGDYIGYDKLSYVKIK